MGQKIYADELAPAPRVTVVELKCDCGECQAWRLYVCHDYIATRQQATNEGWGRRDNQWFFEGHT